MAQLDEARTISDTVAAHVSDHNQLHTKANYVFDVTDFGATGDGVTDDTAAIQAAIDAAEAVAPASVYFPNTASDYSVSSQLNINTAGVTVFGEGNGSKIKVDADSIRLFYVTVSDVTFHSLFLEGFAYGTSNYTVSPSMAGEHGITFVGASSSAYLSNVHVKDCKIKRFSGTGVAAQFIEDFSIVNNRIEDITHSGVSIISGRQGTISSNDVDDVGEPTEQGASAPVDSYGIALSRVEHDSLATHPRPSDVTIANNVVKNVPNWEGIDTHGGHRIVVNGNQVYGCRIGVAIVPCDRSNGDSYFAPRDITVTGNVIDSGLTDGTAHAGISFAGASFGDSFTGEDADDVVDMVAHEYADGDEVWPSGLTGGSGLVSHQYYYVINAATDTFQLSATRGGGAVSFGSDITVGLMNHVFEAATGTISGNTVRGHGLETNANMGALYIVVTEALTVTANVFIQPSAYGINLYNNNRNYTVIGNTVIDAWSDTVTVPSAIALRSVHNDGVIIGNTLRGGRSKTAATYVNVRGLYNVGTVEQSNIIYGNDMAVAATPYSDSGSSFRWSAYGAAPAAKPTVTGARDDGTALADLLTELATLGLITDSSTAS